MIINKDAKELLRFNKKFIIDENGCWIWTSSITRGYNKGYGSFHIYPNKTALAHRVSYELFKSEIPEGLTIDHLCRNRKCVNPDHLEAVTNRENILRGNTMAAKNKTKTHCPRGHEYTLQNTGTEWRKGRAVGRICKACVSIYQRNYYIKRKRG